MMGRTYRRKTNWVPQDERRLTALAEPEDIQPARLRDLVLAMALSMPGQKP
jgi:hypothetical protein